MNYDICDPAIRCGADKIGASVFLIQTAEGKCRVLAYSQCDAERLAQHHLKGERSAIDEPSLFEGF